MTVADFLIREGEIEFCKPIARAVLRDGRLSFGARGLFAFLWDLPHGWRPNVEHLSKMGPEKKDAIRSRLRELQAVGAMRIEPIRCAAGKLSGKRWVLVSPDRWARTFPLTPSSSEPGTEVGKIRGSESPKLGLPNSKVPQSYGSAIDEAAQPTELQGQEERTAPPANTKRRRVRASGIITWTVGDELLADSLEMEYPIGMITAAVAASVKPLPGIVQQQLLRQLSTKHGTDVLGGFRQRSSSDVIAAMSADPRAVAEGGRYLQKTREAKIWRKNES